MEAVKLCASRGNLVRIVFKRFFFYKKFKILNQFQKSLGKYRGSATAGSSSFATLAATRALDRICKLQQQVQVSFEGILASNVLFSDAIYTIAEAF